MSDLPTDEQLRKALLAKIQTRYGGGGVKAFAREARLPYDRVRDHLSGDSKWTVRAMLDYMQALDLSMTDLVTLACATAVAETVRD